MTLGSTVMDDEQRPFIPDDELYPSPEDDLLMDLWAPWFDKSAVLTFGVCGSETFRTTSGEIVLAYLLAADWKRLPGPDDDWLESVPVEFRASARDASGEFITDFSVRDVVAARGHGLSWFKRIETNDDDAPCPHCGSEWFAVFEDAAGCDHRMERLTVMTAVLALSDQGLVPMLSNATLYALEQYYDHLRDTEHVLFACGGGEHG
jgi:hypothetical protein